MDVAIDTYSTVFVCVQLRNQKDGAQTTLPTVYCIRKYQGFQLITKQIPHKPLTANRSVVN